MVFSLFGKKSPPPSKKPEGKPAPGKTSVATPSRPPAKPAAPERPAVSAEDLSLDFTGYVPAAKRKPSPADPKRDAPQPPTAASSPSPVPATPSHRPPDSIMSIEVTASSGDIAPVIEESAILFANGQVDQALAKLSKAVRETDLGASELQSWLMLFDVHQHLGMRAEFEALALEFVVKFERSPPAWMDSGFESRSSPTLATGGTGYCAFTGALSAASGHEFEKLRNLAHKQQIVRVDFSKLQALDRDGSARLRDALVELRASGKEIVLTGEGQLITLLETACQSGKTETDGALWALLFEVYRWFGMQERFEEAAVNYAVTFEVSPPSWEAQPAGGGKPKDHRAAGEFSNQALVLSGDVTGAGEALAKQLQDWAAANNMLVIDMSKARRVDFVSAGAMLNVLSKLRRSGTTIQIRGANEMIAALFEVMGIQSVASVNRRR